MAGTNFYGKRQNPAAVDVSYDPTVSGLAATDVQGALDEVAGLGGAKLTSLHDELGGTLPTGISARFGSDWDNTGTVFWEIDRDDIGVTLEFSVSDDVQYPTGKVLLPAGFYLAGGYVDLASNAGTGRVSCFVSGGQAALFPEGNLSAGAEMLTDIADVTNNTLAAPLLFQSVVDGEALLQFRNDTDATQTWTSASLWFIKL